MADTQEQNNIEVVQAEAPEAESSIASILGGEVAASVPEVQEADETVDDESSKAVDEDESGPDDADEGQGDDASNDDASNDEVSDHLAEMAVLRDRYERAQKNLQDTQRWGHELSRKLKSSKEKVKAYIDEGVLPQDKAQTLLEDTTHDIREERLPATPVEEISALLSQEMENIVKYSNDDQAEVNAAAFQDMMGRVANVAEKEQVVEHLESLKDDPVLMTKKMLEIGKWWNDEYYAEEREAGNAKALRDEYKLRLKTQQEAIDKLEKKIVHLEKNSDYIPTSGYSLPAGATETVHSRRDTSIGSIFSRAKAGKI